MECTPFSAIVCIQDRGKGWLMSMTGSSDQCVIYEPGAYFHWCDQNMKNDITDQLLLSSRHILESFKVTAYVSNLRKWEPILKCFKLGP